MNSPSSPDISVLLPVRNGMPFLPETIESVLGQTFKNFELVVVDDGSTDDTPTYVNALDDARIRYHRLEGGGLVNALNYGIQRSAAEVIARIDGDDVAEPTRLAEQLRAFHENPKLALIGCDFLRIDPRGNVFGKSSINVTSDLALRWMLVFGATFLHPGVAYRRSAVLQVGGYRAEWDVSEDYDLWTRLADVGEIANCSSQLMRKREHPEAVSTRKKDRCLTQSKQISLRYVAQVFPGVHMSELDELLSFVLAPLSGRDAVRGCASFDAAKIRATFEKVAAAANGGDPETLRAVGFYRKQIAARCYNVFKESPLHSPFMYRWVRMAGMLDPQAYNPLAIARRCIRRVTGAVR